ncbi:MAG: hypothetical protein K0R18_1402 [Bacillales bacterium]|jgi:hypothetical protein|nr:hypothetical protein [Bacillales bacterium]
MELLLFVGTLWLICWYLYFFTNDRFPYRKHIVYSALILISIMSIKIQLIEVKINVIFFLFCSVFLARFLKSGILTQISLITSLLIVMMIHSVFYLVSVTNPRIFLGYESILEFTLILLILRLCLNGSLSFLSTSCTGILLGEMFIQIFNGRNFGYSGEQLYAGFDLLSGFILFTFVQFVIRTKVTKQNSRLFLRNQ